MVETVSWQFHSSKQTKHIFKFLKLGRQSRSIGLFGAHYTLQLNFKNLKSLDGSVDDSQTQHHALLSSVNLLDY